MEQKHLRRLHHIHLYALFWKLVIRREMSFRGNFVTMLAGHVSVLTAGLFSTLFFFMKVKTLAGWSLPDMLVFLGTFQLIDGIWMVTAFFNVMGLQQMIREGRLDSVLHKPVDAQWWVTFWKPDVRGIVDIVAGGLLVCYGWLHAGVPASGIRVFLYMLVLGAGVCIWYALNFLFACLSFWFTSVGELFDLSSGLYDIAQRPDNLYGVWIRKGLLFMLPLTMTVSVPARILVQKFQPLEVAWIVIAACLHLMIVRIVWIRGLRRYTSGGSAA